MPYLLEPLAALASRKVNSVDFENESNEDAYAPGLFDFFDKIKRVLEEGIVLQEPSQGQGQGDKDYLAPKYQWDSVIIADRLRTGQVTEGGVGEQEKLSEVNKTGEASFVENGGEQTDNKTAFKVRPLTRPHLTTEELWKCNLLELEEQERAQLDEM